MCSPGRNAIHFYGDDSSRSLKGSLLTYQDFMESNKYLLFKSAHMNFLDHLLTFVPTRPDPIIRRQVDDILVGLINPDPLHLLSAPGCLLYIGDFTTQKHSCTGITKSHYENLYEPIRISWNVMSVFNVALASMNHPLESNRTPWHEEMLSTFEAGSKHDLHLHRSASRWRNSRKVD